MHLIHMTAVNCLNDYHSQQYNKLQQIPENRRPNQQYSQLQQIQENRSLVYGWSMVFNATFNNVSVYLVGETGGLGENNRPFVGQ